jgi:hypothetical protein
VNKDFDYLLPDEFNDEWLKDGLKHLSQITGHQFKESSWQLVMAVLCTPNFFNRLQGGITFQLRRLELLGDTLLRAEIMKLAFLNNPA